MKNYIFLGKSNGKSFCIEGIDVFSHSWQSFGECDIVLEPKTKKPYSFSKYRIGTDSKEIFFLAGKFDDDEWAFFKEANEDNFIF
ncbi:MAG: hypothetical protein IJ861_01450 [Clostridia bacterium]|nr:hypothetical protein [Clostridia bacterium]